MEKQDLNLAASVVVVVILLGAVFYASVQFNSNQGSLESAGSQLSNLVSSHQQTVTNTQTISSVFVSTLTQTSISLVTTTTSQFFTTTSTTTETRTLSVTATVAAPPFLRSSNWNYQVAGSVNCSLYTVVKGDIIVALIQSSGTQQSTLSASDSGGDSYSYITNWAIGWGEGIAFSVAAATGAVSITLTVGQGSGGLSLFCYDIAGVRSQVSYSQGGGHSSGSVSVSAFNVTPLSFAVAIYVDYVDFASSQPPQATFGAGQGLSLTGGSPINGRSYNAIASEFGQVTASSTSCPMSIASQGTPNQGWGAMCFAFPPA